MKEKNKKIDVMGLTDDNQIINQQTLTISEHEVQTKYLMLSINNFNRTDTVLSPGYFNKKTNFIIGEDSSIIGINEQLQRVDDTTSKMVDNNAFILYPIPALNLINNNILEYVQDGKTYDIDLSYDNGLQFGKLLAGSNDPIKLSDIKTVNDGFIRLFVNHKNGLSLNKNILMNSNAEFCLGILKGYYLQNNDTAFFINTNVNIYTFTVILNYLGASYSIRNARDNRKKLFIQLSKIFNKYFPSKFIKKDAYQVSDGKLTLIRDCQHDETDTSNALSSMINSGKILAIPFSSFELSHVTNNNKMSNRMYDLTSERVDATNYSLPLTPIMKNSDGDILGASGIFTKEGIEDSNQFSPEHKDYYKNLNDGEINQWIADDAILGLYNATSHLK